MSRTSSESNLSVSPSSIRLAIAALIVLGVSSILVLPAEANTAGLPFSETFVDPDLRDAATTADWNTTSETLTLQSQLVSASPSLDATTIGALSSYARRSRGGALADVDGDGDLDIVDGIAGLNRLSLNNGDGTFAPATDIGTDSSNTRSVAIADFDGDGTLDIAVANFFGPTHRLYLNNGTASPFTGVAGSDIGTGNGGRGNAVVAADVNSDGKVDLVIGRIFQSNRVYLNNGTSEPFEGVAALDLGDGGETTWYTTKVAAGDVNNDGLIDIILTNGNPSVEALQAHADRRTYLYLNNGSPTDPFSGAGLPIGSVADPAFDTQGVDFGDFNGDGWLDVVIVDGINANSTTGPTLVYFNEGLADVDGNPFSNAGVNATAGDTLRASKDVRVVDINRDGALDLLVANGDPFGVTPGVVNEVFINDGSGNFSVSDLGVESEATSVVLLGDLDGDRDADVVAVNDNPGPGAGVNNVYLNAIAGTPTPLPAAQQLSGRGLSIRVDTEASPIEDVAFSVVNSRPDHTSIDYWLSNNGGATWFIVAPDRSFHFPTTGTDLRWRADLSSLSPAKQPFVDSLVLQLAPTANPDSITVDEGSVATTLDSAAASVLANDADPFATGTANAVLTEDVSNGVLVLNIDGTFSYTHDGSEVSTDEFRYYYDNGTTISDAVAVTISVNPVNDVPVLATPIGAQGATQGVLLNLDVSGNFSDDDGDTLSFSAVGLPTNLSISAAGVISGTPTQVDVDGSPYSVTVTADDGNGDGTADDTFSLTVTNTNDAPVLVTPIGAQGATEDVLFNLDVSGSFNDDDGDTLSFSAVGLPTNLSISAAGVISGTPTQADVNGSPYSVTVTADDGNGDGTADDTFALTVTNVNDAPVLATPTGAQGATEDVLFNLDVSGSFSDDDGDTLSFSAVGLPTNLSISAAGVISGTPTQADVNGSPYSVTVTADDGNGDGTADDTFALTVTNTNDAPILAAAIGAQGATEDVLFSVNVSGNFNDDDGDTLSFSAVGLPTNLTISGAGVISGTPTQADVDGSPYTVTVTADDGNGDGTANDTFALTVTNTNDAPVLAAAIGAQGATEDVLFNLDVSGNFTDDDGDTLSFSAVGLPTNLSISGGGVISGTPTQADADGSPYSVTVTADDGNGDGTANDTFALTISNVNDAPVLATPIGAQSATEDVLLNLDVSGSFDDDDGDTLSFSAAGLPATLTISAAGVISGTPTQTDVDGSPYSVTVTADDGNGDGTANDTFALTVANVNDAPTLATPIGPQSGTEGVLFSLDLSGNFSDDDGDTLSFSAAGLPTSLSISAGGVISGTPTQLDVDGSPYSVTVTADDGNGDGPANDVFALTISNVNDDPRLVSAIGDRSYDQNDNVSLDVSTFFVDDDGDTLSFSATGLPASLTISLAGTISGTLGQPDVEASPFIVSVTVTDGNGGTPASDSFVVDVNNVNDAPQLVASIADQTVVANQPSDIDLSGSFTDIDGDAISYSATGLPVGLSISATGQISGMVDEASQAGSPYTVTLTATDDPGDDSSSDFQLFVADPTDSDLSPTLSAAPSPAMTGDEVAWTVTVSNAGPAISSGAVVDLSWLGEGMTFVTPPAGCMVDAMLSPATASCVLPDVFASDSVSLTFMVTHAAAGIVVATATVASGSDDFNTDNDDVSTTLSVADEFSGGAAHSLGSANALATAVGDIDGDGNMDIVVGTASGEPALIYRSDESNGFNEPADNLPTSAETGVVLLVDLDGDTDLDLLLGGGAEVTTWLNDGAGAFTLNQTITVSGIVAAVVADVDGNGTQDIVVGASPNTVVLLSDGAGGLVLGDSISTTGVSDIAAGLVDGDGLVDIVVSLSGANSTLLLNSGPGTSLSDRASQPFADGGAGLVSVGDLTGDTTADDVLLASPLVLYAGDGSGTYSAGQVLSQGQFDDIALGDIDGDGAIDIIALVGDTVQVLLGDGMGAFVLDSVQLSTPGAESITVSLVNQDSHLDLVVSYASAGGIDVFLNDGFGVLGAGDVTPPEVTLNGSSVIVVAVGLGFTDPGATAIDDVDGDITDAIEVEGSVGNLAGIYTLRYRATDSAGNQGTATRTVRVEAASQGGGGGGGAFSWLFSVMLLGAIAGRRRASSIRYRIRNH